VSSSLSDSISDPIATEGSGPGAAPLRLDRESATGPHQYVVDVVLAQSDVVYYSPTMTRESAECCGGPLLSIVAHHDRRGAGELDGEHPDRRRKGYEEGPDDDPAE